HRVRLPARYFGHGRHPDAHLLQRGHATGPYVEHRRYVSRRLPAHAANADDSAVCVHWSSPGGDLDGHRQPSPAPIGDSGRRWLADRPAHVARCCAAVAYGVPGLARERRKEEQRMKAYGYVFVVLVLSTVAANAGQTPQGQAPKNRAPITSSKTTQGGGQTTQREPPKNGAMPRESSRAEGQRPGGGKDSSSINGTGMGTQH